jgi:hypothetical protein
MAISSVAGTLISSRMQLILAPMNRDSSKTAQLLRAICRTRMLPSIALSSCHLNSIMKTTKVKCRHSQELSLFKTVQDTSKRALHQHPKLQECQKTLATQLLPWPYQHLQLLRLHLHHLRAHQRLSHHLRAHHRLSRHHLLPLQPLQPLHKTFRRPLLQR